MAYVTDKSLQCSTCSAQISATAINDHHHLHKALLVLKFKQGREHLTLETLLKRRRLMIKKLVAKFKDNVQDPDLLKKIGRINESFDIIRSELLRGKSVCHSLTPFIERVSIEDGGLGVEQKDVVADIHCDIVGSIAAETLPACVVAIGMGSAMNVEYKSVMENRTTSKKDFISLGKSSKFSVPSLFFAIFDGYHGITAADHSQQSFHSILQSEIERERVAVRNFTEFDASQLNEPSVDEIMKQLQSELFVHDIHKSEENENHIEKTSCDQTDLLSHVSIARCFRKAYQTMDQHLAWGVGESSWTRWSGCSASTCIISDEIKSTEIIDGAGDKKDSSKDQLNSTSGRIFMANAGDVEAHLFHKNKPYPLTRCHTLYNEEENLRVQKAGGNICGSDFNLTVNSVLQATRGLGNHGDPTLRKCVTCEPYTSTAKIDNNSQFLVVATSSLWRFIEPEEVFALLQDIPRKLSTVKRKNSVSSATEGSVNEDEDGITVEDDLMEKKTVKLASIIETEECGIEEVVIVHRTQDEYEDDESSLASSDAERRITNRGDDLSSNMIRSKRNKIDLDRSDFQLSHRERLAGKMSEELVRAALLAGAKDNVSVSVILFEGFFI